MIRFETRRPSLLLSGVLVAAAALAGACEPRDSQAAPSPKAGSVLKKHEATPERLVERSKARWKLVADKNWIEAYDFSAPEVKKMVSLAQYLPGKSNHEYANPVVGEVVKIEKDQGYVRASSMWTPHHPDLARVKLEPGQSLTEQVDVIESWHFVDGDWWYVRAQNEEEFFHAHPELLRKSETTPSSTPPSK
jgi:hypothetical protein